MNLEFIKRILSSIVLLPFAFFIILKGSFIFITFISICFLISIFEWNNMSKKNPYNKIGFIFLFFSFLCIYNLRINSDDNYILFLFIVVICISTDIGGYVFGKLLKGPKLTIYSPNKTFAGSFGSFIFSIFAMLLFSNIYNEPNISVKFTLFTVMISFISQLGDIIISYFKRKSNIKDSGKIIPGHGGLLDRIDGMIFAFPFSYIIILTNFFE
jgi:phosphatidate cytidylyltransferase